MSLIRNLRRSGPRRESGPTYPSPMPSQPVPEVAREDVLRLADQASLGLLWLDARLIVAAANQAAHLLLERRAPGLVGRSVMETFLDHRLDELVRTAATGGPGAREFTADGSRVLVVRAQPASGGGIWVTLEDVSELRRLQRIRTEFMDNISHELRTPLTTVRLLTEMLLEELGGADVPPRVRERVATIDVETGHLVQMVNELLDLARIEQASTPPAMEAVAVAPLVEASLARLRTFADRQGIELRADVPTDLPAVRGDEERLGQLLVNLLHNAVKFSPDGGHVTVTAARAGPEVVVTVRDEGIGIAPADQDRVFERFYKVDRARHRGAGGTGLGLAIARHIVEAHGGRIWVESSEGNGSSFRFSLPPFA
jgi:two-component system, OmpR family, phosphate regulon sensor histidine kinase PhoR